MDAVSPVTGRATASTTSAHRRPASVVGSTVGEPGCERSPSETITTSAGHPASATRDDAAGAQGLVVGVRGDHDQRCGVGRPAQRERGEAAAAGRPTSRRRGARRAAVEGGVTTAAPPGDGTRLPERPRRRARRAAGARRPAGPPHAWRAPARAPAEPDRGRARRGRARPRRRPRPSPGPAWPGARPCAASRSCVVDEGGRLGERAPGALEPASTAPRCTSRAAGPRAGRLGVDAPAGPTPRPPNQQAATPMPPHQNPGRSRYQPAPPTGAAGDVVELDRGAGDGRSPRDAHAGRPALTSGLVQVDCEQRRPVGHVQAVTRAASSDAGERAPRLGPAQPPARRRRRRVQPHPAPRPRIRPGAGAVDPGRTQVDTTRLAQDRQRVEMRLHAPGHGQVGRPEPGQRRPQHGGLPTTGQRQPDGELLRQPPGRRPGRLPRRRPRAGCGQERSWGPRGSWERGRTHGLAAHTHPCGRYPVASLCR